MHRTDFCVPDAHISRPHKHMATPKKCNANAMHLNGGYARACSGRFCIRLAVVSAAMLFNQLDERQRHKDSRRETERFATKKRSERFRIQTICLGNISQISFDIGPVLSSLLIMERSKKHFSESIEFEKMLMRSNISVQHICTIELRLILNAHRSEW